MVEGSDLASCGSSDSWVTTGIEIEAEHDQFAGAGLSPGVNEPTKTAEPFVITYGANRYNGPSERRQAGGVRAGRSAAHGADRACRCCGRVLTARILGPQRQHEVEDPSETP